MIKKNSLILFRDGHIFAYTSHFKSERLRLNVDIVRFSLKSVLPLTFPVASLEEYQRIFASPPLHSENYTIPIQLWTCPKFKVIWFPWLFIPIFHEADHRRRKQWKSSVKEIKQRLHLGNYTIISWILVSWNGPFGNYFPAARTRAGEKKWAP